MFALIQASPLATLVLATDAGLVANHLPFVLAHESTDAVVLQAHIPKANPLHDWLATPRPALAIFHGPEGNISPSHYATKRAHGKVVPTWNYAVVHVHGTLRRIDDGAWLEAQLEALTRLQEQHREAPWAVGDAPAPYLDALKSVLVGIELTVERMEGKNKASQNQPAVNRASVLAGLRAEAPDAALTAWMQATLGDPDER